MALRCTVVILAGVIASQPAANALAAPTRSRSVEGLVQRTTFAEREQSSDHSVIIVRHRSSIYERGGRALESDCESSYRAGTSQPFRIACVATTRTSTEVNIALIATATIGSPYRGWALTRTSSVQLERASDVWIARSSSTAQELARLSASAEVRYGAGASPADRRGLAAILLLASSVPDLRGDRSLGEVAPGLVGVGRPWSPPPSREPMWARLERVGGRPLAQAFLDLGRPLPDEDPALAAEFKWERYDAPDRWGLSIGAGTWGLVPLGDPSGTLAREATALVITTFGLELGRRFEALFAVGWGGGSLDDRALERQLGPGRVGVLTHFATENSTYGGDVGSIHLMGGLRCALTDWRWRPYVTFWAGRILEPFKYESPDVPASCGDANCPHRAGFRIAAPASAWMIAPGLGLRGALVHGENFGLELRAEALAHLSFWGRPPLIYEGEVTPSGQETYDRLRAQDGGSPAVALGLGLTLEARAGF